MYFEVFTINNDDLLLINVGKDSVFIVEELDNIITIKCDNVVCLSVDTNVEVNITNKAEYSIYSDSSKLMQIITFNKKNCNTFELHFVTSDVYGTLIFNGKVWKLLKDIFIPEVNLISSFH